MTVQTVQFVQCDVCGAVATLLHAVDWFLLTRYSGSFNSEAPYARTACSVRCVAALAEQRKYAYTDQLRPTAEALRAIRLADELPPEPVFSGPEK